MRNRYSAYYLAQLQKAGVSPRLLDSSSFGICIRSDMGSTNWLNVDHQFLDDIEEALLRLAARKDFL